MAGRGERLVVVATCAALAAIAAPPLAVADTATFNYTGATQTWTVPSGVTQATFDLYGAQGHATCPADAEGAHVTGTIAVTPGETLQVGVGGHTGFNGGGGPSSNSGGGGSDVRRGPAFTLADRLLVAGGGGGDADGVYCPGGDARGRGGASGAVGNAGITDDTANGGGGGHPGTSTAGGAGGGAGPGPSTNGAQGSDGSPGQGGDGASTGGLKPGGGGGGYYGGGGGGTGGTDSTKLGMGEYHFGNPGGGGGGSSYPGDATGASVTDGVQAGDGMVVVTYTSASGNGGGGGGGGPPPTDTNPPAFLAARITNPTFAVPKNGAPQPLALAKAKKPKKGTTFVYRLSEAARVLFTIDRKSPGRKVGGKCRKPTRKNKNRKRCTRFVRLGAFAQNGVAGSNSKKWSGKLGTKALKPGRYRASLTATDAAGNVSKITRLSFRIVRG